MDSYQAFYAILDQQILKNTGMSSGKRPWQWSYPMLRHARRTQDSLSGSLLSIKYWNLFKKVNRVGQTLDYEPLWPEYWFLQGFIRVSAKCYFTSDGFRIAYRPPSFLLGFTRVRLNSSRKTWRGTASGPIRILRFCFVLLEFLQSVTLGHARNWVFLAERSRFPNFQIFKDLLV